MMVWGSGSSYLNGNRTSAMKILGQEPLTEVTEEPWGLSQSPYSRLFLVLIKLTKESTKWPARSPSGISWGREWRDVAGLIIAFLLLLLLFVRKQEHFPCLCFLVLGCLFFFFFQDPKDFKIVQQWTSPWFMFWIPIQIQLFNSKEMLLEEDNRGYFEDDSKWVCHYCLWVKSAYVSQSLFPDASSRGDPI